MSSAISPPAGSPVEQVMHSPTHSETYGEFNISSSSSDEDAIDYMAEIDRMNADLKKAESAPRSAAAIVASRAANIAAAKQVDITSAAGTHNAEDKSVIRTNSSSSVVSVSGIPSSHSDVNSQVVRTVSAGGAVAPSQTSRATPSSTLPNPVVPLQHQTVVNVLSARDRPDEGDVDSPPHKRARTASSAVNARSKRTLAQVFAALFDRSDPCKFEAAYNAEFTHKYGAANRRLARLKKLQRVKNLHHAHTLNPSLDIQVAMAQDRLDDLKMRQESNLELYKTAKLPPSEKQAKKAEMQRVCDAIGVSPKQSADPFDSEDEAEPQSCILKCHKCERRTLMMCDHYAQPANRCHNCIAFRTLHRDGHLTTSSRRGCTGRPCADKYCDGRSKLNMTAIEINVDSDSTVSD